MGREFGQLEPTLNAGMVAAAISGMRELGLDTEQLLKSAGLPGLECRDGPPLTVDYARISRLWEIAVEASGDPALGLHVAQQLEPENFSLLLYLGRTASGFREAISDLSHHNALLGCGVSFTLVERDGPPTLVHRVAGSIPEHPASADYVLAAVVTLIRKEVSLEFTPARVRFTRDRPANVGEYEVFFGCSVEFEAAANEIEFRELEELSPESPDPALHEILAGAARQRAREFHIEEPFEQRLRGIISAEFVRGRPSAACLALRLGMSERTLRRRLAERDVTLRGLVDQVRFELAQRQLSKGVAISVAASRLGFSETSAFYRAYRRWTGTTPGSQRAAIARDS